MTKVMTENGIIGYNKNSFLTFSLIYFCEELTKEVVGLANTLKSSQSFLVLF